MILRRSMCYLFCISFMITFPLLTYAKPSPLGLWQTYDLNHHPRDIVRISLDGNQLVGAIVKSSNKIAVCQACKGDSHNKPLSGMKIIWGLKQVGNNWENGHVLSIDDGKIYQCDVSVSDDNKILYFSPYLGAPLFGVTIHWIRVNSSLQQ